MDCWNMSSHYPESICSSLFREATVMLFAFSSFCTSSEILHFVFLSVCLPLQVIQTPYARRPWWGGPPSTWNTPRCWLTGTLHPHTLTHLQTHTHKTRRFVHTALKLPNEDRSKTKLRVVTHTHTCRYMSHTNILLMKRLIGVLDRWEVTLIWTTTPTNTILFMCETTAHTLKHVGKHTPEVHTTLQTVSWAAFVQWFTNAKYLETEHNCKCNWINRELLFISLSFSLLFILTLLYNLLLNTVLRLYSM